MGAAYKQCVVPSFIVWGRVDITYILLLLVYPFIVFSITSDPLHIISPNQLHSLSPIFSSIFALEMALVAENKELANLIDTNPSVMSPAIDEDLQHRIRSLFNSRNERNPARIPLPSPETSKRTSSYYHHDESLVGSDLANASLGVEYNRASLSRRSRLWRSELGSSRFDGSDVFSRTQSNTLTRHTTPESSRTTSPTIISSEPLLLRRNLGMLTSEFQVDKIQKKAMN